MTLSPSSEHLLALHELLLAHFEEETMQKALATALFERGIPCHEFRMQGFGLTRYAGKKAVYREKGPRPTEDDRITVSTFGFRFDDDFVSLDGIDTEKALFKRSERSLYAFLKEDNMGCNFLHSFWGSADRLEPEDPDMERLDPRLVEAVISGIEAIALSKQTQTIKKSRGPARL